MNNIDKYDFVLAKPENTEAIWKILQQAVERRKKDGSLQWQDGYPNLETVKNDLDKNYGYVLKNNEAIIAYAALIKNFEPAYNEIIGNWLTNGEFLVVHRVAVSSEVLGKGIATKVFNFIEDWAVANNIPSIKVDTNYDNPSMLRILQKLGYTYCGEVYFRGSARKAFEKVL